MWLRSAFNACLAALFVLSSNSACTVGPNYHRPTTRVPESYKEATAAPDSGWKTATPADLNDRGDWWSLYEDPLLDDLIRRVTLDNQTLRVYEAAFWQASALAYAARSALLPSLSLTPALARGRSNGLTETTRSVSSVLSWDLDLWGRLRRQLESDRAAARASEAQLDAAQLSAQADLVSDYFQLRYADALQALLTSTVDAYQRTLEITQNQYGAGVAARSDVITAETQLQATRAQLISAGISRAQLEHAIALLIGRPPVEVSIPIAALATRVPSIPLTLPSTLLERRPDIAQAERTVQRQSALIGVAKAAYYPDISLSGLIGYSTTATGPLITASNRIWSGSATGSQYLFDFGQHGASVMAARAAHEQSVAQYRQTVLVAFEEVETCLSTLRILAEQARAQSRAVDLAHKGVEIAINEYEAGLQSYTTVVTAQQIELSDQESQLQIELNRLLQSVALIKALGGGWQNNDG